jgi:hypothetical protein
MATSGGGQDHTINHTAIFALIADEPIANPWQK